MAFKVFYPAFDDLGVRVPGLDRTLVYFTLKVFLLLLVSERTFEDCPERALGGYDDRTRDRDGEGGSGMRSEVSELVKKMREVGTEMNYGNWDVG